MSDVEELSPTTRIQDQSTSGIASLYVGDLAPETTEQDLLDCFQTCGIVLGVRILRDIVTRRSLGYAYVNFQRKEEAQRAIETLNFTEVCGRPMRIMFQQRDPATRLNSSGNVFVKNLDSALDSKALNDLFKAFGSVLSAKVMSNDDGKSRRYGFVHFADEKAASDAIAKMNGSDEYAGDSEKLYVAPFLRRNARIAALMLNFTNIYIKHILPSIDKDEIENFFSKFGGISSACTKKDAKGRVFAFCNFEKHDDAVKAIEEYHGKPIEGLSEGEEGIYIQRAQPRCERLVELRVLAMKRQALGSNLYVRNFPLNYTDEDLTNLFAEFGEVKSAKVITDEQGNPRGFGFVCFATPEQANAALRDMSGRLINDKPLVVCIAQRRDQRRSMLRLQFQQRLLAMSRPSMMPPAFKAPSSAPRHLARLPVSFSTLNRPPMQATYPSRRDPPQRSPSIAPETPPLAPLNENDLYSMPDEERKVALGERLFVRVAELTPELAPKITGMFLEMPTREAFALLENPAMLEEKVREAICVIHAHQMQNK